MRLAALEQCREQPTEVRVDLLIGFEQPDAALAVEIADRAAQAVDRLSQLFDFVRALGSRRVELGQLGFGNQIDRTNAFALGCQPLERRGFFVGIALLVAVKAELLGKALRNYLELVDRGPRELGASSLLGLGPRRRSRPALACVGRAL